MSGFHEKQTSSNSVLKGMRLGRSNYAKEKYERWCSYLKTWKTIKKDQTSFRFPSKRLRICGEAAMEPPGAPPSPLPHRPPPRSRILSGAHGSGLRPPARPGPLGGALGGAVVVGAAVGILRLALGDGLHGRVVEPAADAVAAAAGRGGRSRASDPRRRRRGKVLGGKAFRVNSRGARREWGQRLGPGGPLRGLMGTLRGLGQELPGGFGQDGALQDLGSRHAVTGIRATPLLEQQQLKLFVRRVGLFGVSVDEAGRPLAARHRHAAVGRSDRTGAAAKRCPRFASSRHIPRIFSSKYFPLGPFEKREKISIRVDLYGSKSIKSYSCTSLKSASVHPGCQDSRRQGRGREDGHAVLAPRALTA